MPIGASAKLIALFSEEKREVYRIKFCATIGTGA